MPFTCLYAFSIRRSSVPNAKPIEYRLHYLRLLLSIFLTLGLTSGAFAQNDCESRCVKDYGDNRYPTDQNLCLRNSAPGRCIDETWANARNFCRDRCNANYQAPAEKPAPVLNLKGIQSPDSGEPIPKPPASATGHRG